MDDKTVSLLRRLNEGGSVTEEENEYLLLSLHGPEKLKIYQTAKRGMASLMENWPDQART